MANICFFKCCIIFTNQEVLDWLVPCLSVEPASRPSVHDLLQRPFFLRLAAAEYLDAVSQEEAEARLAAGESPPLPGAGQQPWLALALSRAFRRSTGGCSDSSSSSGGLPPLKPRAHIDVTFPRSREVCSDECGSQLDAADTEPETGYSHLDPDVLAEMEGLDMIDTA